MWIKFWQNITYMMHILILPLLFVGGALEESIIDTAQSQLLDTTGKVFPQSLVGSISYIASKTHPNIAHLVMQLYCRMSNPMVAYLTAAK